MFSYVTVLTLYCAAESDDQNSVISPENQEPQYTEVQTRQADPNRGEMCPRINMLSSFPDSHLKNDMFVCLYHGSPCEEGNRHSVQRSTQLPARYASHPLLHSNPSSITL